MKAKIKTPILSAIAFFGTLGILSVGYSAYVSNYPATATAGVTVLSAGEWNKMVSALQTLDNNLSTFTISGGNVGIGGTPNAKFNVSDSISNLRFGHNLSTGSSGPSLMLETASNVYADIVWKTAGADQVRLRGSSYGLAIGGSNPRLNIGYADANYTTAALVVNGNVGIGTSAPSNRLHVDGNIGATGWIGAGCETACSDVASGYAIMYADGRGISTVGWTTNSDIRIKKDIRPIENPIGKLKKINGIRYRLKEGDGTDKIGVIAQEIEAVFPEMVSETPSGIKTVNYDKLVAPLIEAVKIQQNEIDALKLEVRDLKNR